MDTMTTTMEHETEAEQFYRELACGSCGRKTTHEKLSDGAWVCLDHLADVDVSVPGDEDFS